MVSAECGTDRQIVRLVCFDNQRQWSIQHLDFRSEETSSYICLHGELLAELAVHQWNVVIGRIMIYL